MEAATENVSLKLSIFEQLDQLAPAAAILASNTSSISIGRIAAATRRPDRVIGMHFMNPVPVMKLVEIINGYATDKSDHGYGYRTQPVNWENTLWSTTTGLYRQPDPDAYDQ